MKKTKIIDKDSTERRGDKTRQALIAAGLELFGEYGLKGTSTRMLSSHSGANISAIPYYFGNKDGLYKAVVEHIVERVAVHTDSIRNELTELLARGLMTPKQALEALKKLLSVISRLMLESDEPKTWARIMVREQANPTHAFNIFYEGQIKPMQQILVQLISVCSGLNPKSDEIKIRCHALFGQILGFLVARENIRRHLGVKKLSLRHIELIHQVILTNTENCLKPLASTKERP